MHKVFRNVVYITVRLTASVCTNAIMSKFTCTGYINCSCGFFWTINFSHEPLFDVEGNGKRDISLDEIYAETQNSAYSDSSLNRGRISSISSSQGSVELPDAESKDAIGKDIGVIPEEDYPKVEEELWYCTGCQRS